MGVYLTILLLTFANGQELIANGTEEYLLSVDDSCENCSTNCSNMTDSDDCYRICMKMTCPECTPQIISKDTNVEIQSKHHQKVCDVCSNIEIQGMYKLKRLACEIKKCGCHAKVQVNKYLVGFKTGEKVSFSKMMKGSECIQCANDCYKHNSYKYNKVWRCIRKLRGCHAKIQRRYKKHLMRRQRRCNRCVECLRRNAPTKCQKKCEAYEENSLDVIREKMERKYKKCSYSFRKCLRKINRIKCQKKKCKACVENQVTIWNRVLPESFRVFEADTLINCMRACRRHHPNDFCSGRCEKLCNYYCTKCFRARGLWICHGNHCPKCAVYAAAICNHVLTKPHSMMVRCLKCHLNKGSRFGRTECFSSCKDLWEGICSTYLNTRIDKEKCQFFTELSEQCVTAIPDICVRSPKTKDRLYEVLLRMNRDDEMPKTLYYSNRTTICNRKCFVEEDWICQTENCLECVEIGKTLCSKGFQRNTNMSKLSNVSSRICPEECNDVFKDMKARSACTDRCNDFCYRLVDRSTTEKCTRCVARYQDNDLCRISE